MELTVRRQNQHAYILTLKKLLLGEIFMKFNIELDNVKFASIAL